jgi:dTDP-glucose 4,6-dehydratase
MHIVVTGGYGFIGSSFVKLAIAAGHQVSIIDKMTYAADLANIDVEIADRCNFEVLDISEQERLFTHLNKLASIDYIVNFAAESHVDRSINDGRPFVQSNILGVVNLLEFIKKNKKIKFLQVSTDEVYGSIYEGSWKESATIDPRSPYSASKASAELFCSAYRSTHQLQVTITRCANNFGPKQSAEKLIPTVIRSALANIPVPVYGNGSNVREWIYVDDHAAAILRVVEKNNPRHKIYNIGGESHTNIELVKLILNLMGKGEGFIEFVSDRPGHDFRYSVDSSLFEAEFGETESKLLLNLKNTVDWYLENLEWLKRSEGKVNN